MSNLHRGKGLTQQEKLCEVFKHQSFEIPRPPPRECATVGPFTS